MTVGIHRKDSIGYGVESTEGTAVAAAAGTMFYAQEISHEINQESIARMWADDTFGEQSPVTGAKTPTISFTTPVRGSGDTSTSTRTAPEIGELWKTLFGSEDVTDDATTLTTSSSTTTVVKYAASMATAFTEGHAIAVNDPESGSNYSVGWITDISTTDVTVTPALDNAPTTGQQTYAAAMYNLASSGHQSLSIDYYEGDVIKHVFAGCKCTATIGAEAGKTPTAQWSFQGMSHTPTADTDGPAFTPTYDAQKEAAVKYGRVYIDSTAVVVKNINIDPGVVVTPRPSQNASEAIGGFVVTDFQPTITLEGIECEDLTFLNYLTNATSVDIKIQWGRTIGNIIAVRAPTAYVISTPIASEDGKKIHSVSFKCIKSSGNDQLKLAFL